MASSLQTTESPPGREGTLPSPFDFEQEPKIREWTQFELDTACSLICKHEHLSTSKEKLKRFSLRRGNRGAGDADDWTLQFATKLNEALHGVHYKHDIPVTDVRELMDFIETRNQTVMAYIKRQSAPFRITRSKKYVFQRLRNTFNHAFRKWTIVRRKERRHLSIETGEEMPRLGWADRYPSSQNQDNYLLGTAPIQKNTPQFASTEGGWISNSVYGRGSHEGLYINTTAGSGLDPSAYSLQRPILSEKPSLRLHHKRHRIQSLPIPPPPPSLDPPTQCEQVEVQPFETYDMGIYGGAEPDERSHTTRHVYHDHLDPALSATPYSPISPAFYNHADLRQSIHPTGPRPKTPMVMPSHAYHYHSELQQSLYPTDSAPGSLTLLEHVSPYGPMHRGFQYPEPPQDNRNFDYIGILETPTSPSSLTYMSGAASTMVVGGDTGAQSPIKPIYEDESGNDFYPVSGGYSEYSLGY
ncbi:hypothetical protein EKO27_g4731 [Xylaria grammica]|uniref:Uncharacterized protein n=1 Tax=Xylaria grammica TaxID=363999 RepID=A0A439D7L1_9PEZI|nr:hypothetical protein EKO27_g4731 [Xylaria grammica]